MSFGNIVMSLLCLLIVSACSVSIYDERIDYHTSNTYVIEEIGQCISGDYMVTRCVANIQGREVITLTPVMVGTIVQERCYYQRLSGNSCPGEYVRYNKNNKLFSEVK